MSTEVEWHGRMPTLADRPARLADPVVYDLCDKVVSGALRVGASLPGEPELCSFYGVSRTVVREAVQSLQKRGLVQVRQGQKTTVLGEKEWNLLDPVVLEATVRHDADLAILDDLVEVRVSLETQMASRAALLGTAQQFEELAGALGRMQESLDDPAAYWSLDADFHDTFMVASGNRLARVVVRAIHEKARGSTRYNGTPDRSDMELGHLGHVQICQQITMRQPEAAAAAVREHILGSWERRKAQRPQAPGRPGR